MHRSKTLNSHQKAARRRGECRVNAPEVAQLVSMAGSEDARDRLTAAQFLCPCHVRTGNQEASAALRKLMEDPDVRVRRAAWHTLEDGGGGDDPEIQALADKLWPGETDRNIRWLIETVCGSRVQHQRLADKMAALSAPRRRGKCDFCGRTNILVSEQFDRSIPADSGPRPARICQDCARRDRRFNHVCR
jgi:hypothetical protein